MHITLTKRMEKLLSYIVDTDPEHEIGGFGKLAKDNAGLVITDLIVPPQKVGGAHIHMGTDEFAWAMEELAKRGETLSEWNCWWHSHAKINVFASSTDTDTLDKFADMVKQRWAIGLVTNAAHAYYSWLNIQQGGPWPVVQEKVPVWIEKEPIDKELQAQAVEMVKVVTKDIAALHMPGQWGGNYGTYGDYDGPVYKDVKSLRNSSGLPDKKRDSNPYGSTIVTWCDMHEEWSDMCPVPHLVAVNKECPHQPNCGEGGCFSKANRRELKKKRRAVRGEIDPDDIDAAFDAMWEAEMLGATT